ncbi:Zinc finger- C2H2-type/integrase- DNA-binding protein [Apiospora marii]|uniref:Zinc finger- C2H2-type/integrase- DNA-binding protein n=1 Tax=Apiospora marii TaxID=335849 RepID=UPI00312F5697
MDRGGMAVGCPAKMEFVQDQQETQPPVKGLPCSTCSKNFTTPSKLAIHERIHTGDRPYGCDHPGCVKPYGCERCGKTRDRHQKEEAAAVMAAVLAQQANKGNPGSNHASPNLHSPACRNMSISPNDELASADAIRRNEYSYMNNNGGTDMYLQSPPLALAMFGMALRPSSYTTSYPPPPTLEPSIEPHQPGPGSAGGTPHMDSVGWASSSHMYSHMPSPIHGDSGSTACVYPDLEESPKPYGRGQMW